MQDRIVQLALASALALAGCAARPRAAFHPSDPSFSPRPGPTPSVYVRREDVPRIAMRSVGIIRVNREGGRAIEAAAEEGRELGCWAVIEHELFLELSRRSTLDVVIILTHGGAPHVSSLHPPRATEFDCVVKSSFPASTRT